MIPKVSRLPGIDGKAKMSKSLGNAIYLSDEPDVIKKKVMGMFTDPTHLRVEDPGHVEGNPVFIYLDAFCEDVNRVQELKEHYTRGGLGDVKVKKYLLEVLNEIIDPIRKKRNELEQDKEYVFNVLKDGTNKAREIASKTLEEVKEAIGIDYNKSLFL